VATIQVKVKPGARASTFECLADGTYLAQVKSPPVDGKANAELIALAAKHFGTTKACVTIKSGGGGRTKLLIISD
jgi:uncharacterized protein